MGGPVWVLLWSLRCHPFYGPEAWGLRSVVVTRASATRAGQSPQAVTSLSGSNLVHVGWRALE